MRRYERLRLLIPSIQCGAAYLNSVGNTYVIHTYVFNDELDLMRPAGSLTRQTVLSCAFSRKGNGVTCTLTRDRIWRMWEGDFCKLGPLDPQCTKFKVQMISRQAYQS